MNQQSVIVEAEYPVPVEKVWEALTNPDQMRQWYFDLEEFKAEPGFEFSFTGEGSQGDKYVHICRVTEVIPYQKLSYTWAYENLPGQSHVLFELFDLGAATRLKLTHEGLETFPQNHPDFRRESFSGGWNELIPVLLKKYLTGNPTV